MAGDTDIFFLNCRNISLSDQLLPTMLSDGLLDTSNYDNSNPLFSTALKAKIGLVKDESSGHGYKEWVFLRPKCYSLLSNSNNDTKKAKGIQRASVKKLRHEQYKKIVDGEISELFCPHNRIGSEKHQLYTYQTQKRALSANDDKRSWVGPNTSYAYGHWRLEEEEEEPLAKRMKASPSTSSLLE